MELLGAEDKTRELTVCLPTFVHVVHVVHGCDWSVTGQLIFEGE